MRPIAPPYEDDEGDVLLPYLKVISFILEISSYTFKIPLDGEYAHNQFIIYISAKIIYSITLFKLTSFILKNDLHSRGVLYQVDTVTMHKDSCIFKVF